MRYFKGNKGFIQPFKIVQGDGTTAKDLTGLTITWYLVARDATQPTGSPITGSVTDAANGLVEFTVPVGICAAIATFTCRINLTDGVNYDEDTDEFDVSVDNPTQR